MSNWLEPLAIPQENGSNTCKYLSPNMEESDRLKCLSRIIEMVPLHFNKQISQGGIWGNNIWVVIYFYIFSMKSLAVTLH